MSNFERIEVAKKFVEMARALKTNEGLYELLEAVTVEIGFRYFALISHTDLKVGSRNIVRLDNYPSSWSEYFIENGLFKHDPVLQASLTSAVGFFWGDIPKMIKITSKQKFLLESAAKHGLSEGFTVPANIPGETPSSCSFAVPLGPVVPAANFLLAQLIGAFASQAARRLSQIGSVSKHRFPRLTPRQLDCLLWAIKGKTDWEISRILGLREETVTEHLNAARERYGVTKRLPLAIHAIFDGQISFNEALF